MTNYANWFAYYRTRIQAAKTVISQNFIYLDDEFRVGFHTLSNNPTDVVRQRRAVRRRAEAGVVQPAVQHPHPDGQQHAQHGGDRADRRAVQERHRAASLAGATDPIVLSCQRNFHMLFTDGAQNQTAMSAPPAGDKDDTISIPYDLPLAAPPLINGATWPHLYRQDPARSVANTLADFAMKYWATDMRPGMIDDSILSSSDPAPWQHLNFAALALGTEDVLNSRSVSATEAQIAAGTVNWPTPTGGLGTFQPLTGGVDDLWHAAVNAPRTLRQREDVAGARSGHPRILRDLASSRGTDSAARHRQSEPQPGEQPHLHRLVRRRDGNGQEGADRSADRRADRERVGRGDRAHTQLTPTVPVRRRGSRNRRVVTIERRRAGPVPVRLADARAQLATLGPDATTQTGVSNTCGATRRSKAPMTVSSVSARACSATS